VTVANVDVVDFVAEAPDGRFVLAMTEDRPWEDNVERLLQLQDKIRNYMIFCETGQLVSKYPAAANRKILFEIYSVDEPTRDVAKLLKSWSHELATRGIALTQKLIPPK